MYNWISSFLYHKVARVKLDGSLSREIRLSEGVPQGSVLSPTLFLLYVNDVVNTLPPRVTNSLHADDLAVWTSAEHTSTATHVMEETINRVSSWADEWCMEINCSGTQATLFSLSTVNERVVLRLEDMPVPQVDNQTFLGVTLDTPLTNIRWLIVHIYTPTAQRKVLLEKEAVVSLSGPQQDKQLATQILLAENVQISKQKPQNAVAYIAEMKPQKTVILTDSIALQSLISSSPDQQIHQLLKDLQLLPHECTVVLHWILWDSRK